MLKTMFLYIVLNFIICMRFGLNLNYDDIWIFYPEAILTTETFYNILIYE
jgi:hypothetical protein